MKQLKIINKVPKTLRWSLFFRKKMLSCVWPWDVLAQLLKLINQRGKKRESEWFVFAHISIVKCSAYIYSSTILHYPELQIGMRKCLIETELCNASVVSSINTLNINRTVQPSSNSAIIYFFSSDCGPLMISENYLTL